LGRFFTYDVAVHAGQTVVEVGPYRHIRHPSYSGALTTRVGPGLALRKLGRTSRASCLHGYCLSMPHTLPFLPVGRPSPRTLASSSRT
jgi:hypothetical protein